MIVPKLNAVLETALYVEDLERSVCFYKTIFEFEPISSSERLCALNVSNRQVLLLFLKGASTVAKVTSGGIIPPTDGDGQLHLAFAIAVSELEQWENWLIENDIEIESKVKWTRGGTSIYFRDPDKHLLELATPGLWTIY
ncbi:VOC family protein [soil metagenome]|jgi:catechol 2,3-dioxygenase-like lactoylglutathione lyase family enzyme